MTGNVRHTCVNLLIICTLPILGHSMHNNPKIEIQYDNVQNT